MIPLRNRVRFKLKPCECKNRTYIIDAGNFICTRCGLALEDKPTNKDYRDNTNVEIDGIYETAPLKNIKNIKKGKFNMGDRRDTYLAEKLAIIEQDLYRIKIDKRISKELYCQCIDIIIDKHLTKEPKRIKYIFNTLIGNKLNKVALL